MPGFLITRYSREQITSLQGWPDSLSGLKLYVAGGTSPERAAAVAEFQSRGAIVVSLASADVATALVAGVINAAWYPPMSASIVDQIASQNGLFAYREEADGSLSLYIEGTIDNEPPSVVETGTNGDDSFQSANGANNDEFDGGGGRDSVAYRGTRDQYTLDKTPEGAILASKPNGGTDTLSSIELIKFSDQIYNLETRAAAASLPDATVNALIDLYIAYFNRLPEASGLMYWIEQYHAGQTLDQIAARFYDAGVTFTRLTGYSADMTLQEFVKVVYRNVLDRTGDNAPAQSEIDYWLSQLTSGAVTREGLVKQVLSDARLFYGDPDVGYVPELLDSKVELGRLHAVIYGIDYSSIAVAYPITQRLALSVEPGSIDMGVGLMGIGPGEYIA